MAGLQKTETEKETAVLSILRIIEKIFVQNNSIYDAVSLTPSDAGE